jgi:hypothetical protein
MRVIYTRGYTLPLGGLIRRVSGVAADHCGLVIAGQVWDVAMLSPVQPRPLGEWLGMRGRQVAWDIEAPLQDEAAGALAVTSREGRGYDYLGAAGIALWADLQDPARDYCTELVCAYAEAAQPGSVADIRGRWCVAKSLSMVTALASRTGGRISRGALLQA